MRALLPLALLVGCAGGAPPPTKAPEPVAKTAEPFKSPADAGVDETIGYLTVGSKPLCKIYIDGVDTGRRTPQRHLTVDVGRHQLTLVHDAFQINETFEIEIRPGETTKLIKDFTGQLPPSAFSPDR